jgi:predicted PurR-regulated permease PerM
MQNSTIRTILQVIGVFLGLYALYFFRGLVGYLLVSVALSFAGRPIVNLVSKGKIKGRHISSSVGAVLALMSFITLGGVVLGMFGPLVAAEAKVACRCRLPLC